MPSVEVGVFAFGYETPAGRQKYIDEGYIPITEEENQRDAGLYWYTSNAAVISTLQPTQARQLKKRRVTQAKIIQVICVTNRRTTNIQKLKKLNRLKINIQ